MNNFLYLLLFWSIAVTANENHVFDIRTKFSIKNIFCTIEHNDVIGVDNRVSAASGRGFGNGSVNSLLVLKNGENTVTITVAALGWFNLESKGTNKDINFNSESNCSLSISKFNRNDGDMTPIIKFEVKINKDGVPEAYVNGKLDNILEKKVETIKYSAGIIKNKIYDVDFSEFPHEMQVYKFSKKFSINGVPDWNWDKDSEFNNSEEQLIRLKKEYLIRWGLYNSKNINKIKELMMPALSNWSLATGSETNDIFNSYGLEGIFNSKSFSMHPIDWNNFEVKVMNDGKLVKMVYKDDPSFSPLTMNYFDEDDDESVEAFSPIFSLINNEWVEVL